MASARRVIGRCRRVTTAARFPISFKIIPSFLDGSQIMAVNMESRISKIGEATAYK
ncbi:hypothetical protein Q2T46_06460 [Thermoanaerobacterium sp. CMT5567-10]|uniref:hypothetical protein n=1 Tax=Thermoanaerobacterium sp. CMT5567-10 TaxID=3061989 RepID=UPI0026E112C6|nr:hypothetical protein [Thermoanaerobacterium sp. CMT5567-10]WKV10070.1 hypothetical protein Q2T46_06460 [Thermoanaerobacterium sp. CMT5567-10]